ncbi:MFS transporter [Thermomicrobiaceae bacterium CFH 74404]|uniref:MFS transporter n=1 Tax=Thermalbibacter longus TaxID=2951981 RepID=A0AA42BC91_9BACT|nr:MFS transporter [Thermalbibacter longus]MCM8748533.1 MFS transporter [Thermalbibacter longus]
MERQLTVSESQLRRVLATLVVVMVVNQTGVVIISPLVVEIASTFQVPVGLAGQLRTAGALVSGLAAPWLGALSDRAGRKPVILAGLVVVGISALASALAPGFGWLLVIQALSGLGIAALLSTGLAAIGDYVPPERRAWAVGLVTTGQPLAWVIGLPLIGLLADTWGWRWSYLGVPFLFSIAGLALAWRLPPGRYQDRRPRSGITTSRAVRQALADRAARFWVLAELLIYSGWAGSLTFLGAYYIQVFQLSAGQASPLLAAVALAFSLGSLLAHRLARWRAPVVVFGSAIAAAGLLSLALTIRLPLGMAVALLCGYGLIHGVRGATSSALGLRLGEAHRGTMMALRASVVQLGYVFGGLFGGALLERWGFPALAIAYAAFLVGGGLITWRGISGER